MKLILKRVDGLMNPAGMPCFVLATDSGELLPCQSDLTIEQPCGGLQRVTVTFVVDGRGVIVEPLPESAD